MMMVVVVVVVSQFQRLSTVAVWRLEGVAPEVNLNKPLHAGDKESK